MSLWQDEKVLFNCRHQHYFKGYATQNAINRISSRIEKEDDIYDNFQRPRAAFPATIPYIPYSYSLRDPFAFATILFPKLLFFFLFRL